MLYNILGVSLRDQISVWIKKLCVLKPVLHYYNAIQASRRIVQCAKKVTLPVN